MAATSCLLGEPIFSCRPSYTASCTNLQCTVTEDTFELLTKVNPLDHFNKKWHNNQLKLELPQLPNIFGDAGEAFKAPMRELFNKYGNSFTKLGKLVA